MKRARFISNPHPKKVGVLRIGIARESADAPFDARLDETRHRDTSTGPDRLVERIHTERKRLANP